MVFSGVALFLARLSSELLKIGLGAAVFLISGIVLVLARQSVAFGIGVSQSRWLPRRAECCHKFGVP